MKRIVFAGILLGISILALSPCKGMESIDNDKMNLFYFIRGASAGLEDRIKKYGPKVDDPNEYLSPGFLKISENTYYLNALSAAALNGHKNVIAYLFSQEATTLFKGKEIDIDSYHQDDTDDTDDTKYDFTNDALTPIMFAILGKKYEVINQLFDLGADINFQNDYSITPLMFAAYYNDEKSVTLILDRHPDLSLWDNDNETALDFAKENSPSEKLIKEKQKPYEDFIAAAYQGDLEQVRNLRGTIMYIDAKFKHIDAITSADINYPVNAMDAAILGNHAPIVSYLLTEGADVNSRLENAERNTLLIQAVIEKDLALVKALLDKNPDLTMKNEAGQTALDLATLLPNKDIAKALEPMPVPIMPLRPTEQPAKIEKLTTELHTLTKALHNLKGSLQ